MDVIFVSNYPVEMGVRKGLAEVGATVFEVTAQLHHWLQIEAAP